MLSFIILDPKYIKMNGFGAFQNVPDDEFRLILDYLSFKDIGNFRCVSKG